MTTDNEANSFHDNLQNILQASRQNTVDNPFRRWEEDDIESIVKAFIAKYRLKDKQEVFLQAGCVLRRPENWKSFEDDLPHSAFVALQGEKGGFFTQPKPFRITILTLCVGAIVQGWTQTISNGANLSWPAAIGLDSFAHCQPTTLDVWRFALVNAVPWFAASFIGTWFSDPISEYMLGRRAPILTSALVMFAAALGSAYSQSWQQLLACRVILGIGMGCKATVVPVFAAEVSPPHIRGSLVMNWRVFDAFGIFLGFSANLIASQVGPNSWRWQMASLCLPTLVLIILIYTCPDSPRYLMKRSAQRREQRLRAISLAIRSWFGNVFRACFCVHDDENEPPNSNASSEDIDDNIQQDYRKAFNNMVILRGHEILAAKELLHVHFQMILEVENIRTGRIPDTAANANERHPEQHTDFSLWLESPTREPLKYHTKIGQLFSKDRIRRGLVTAVVCMLSQQLCGVNVLAFYSSTLFHSTSTACLGNGERASTTPLWLSWGIGMENVLFALPAYWLIEKGARRWLHGKGGRRWLLLATTPGMTLTMLAATLSYLIPKDATGHTPTIAFFTYVFMAFYSLGMGPVPFTISSEVFPMEHRMVGMSVAVFVNFLGAGLLTLFVPVIAHSSFSNVGLLGVFAVLNVLAFVLIFLFVRETAGAAVGRQARSMTALSLEDLTVIFNVKTWGTDGFKDYQLSKVLPWALKYARWKLKYSWQALRRLALEKRDPSPKKPENLILWAEDIPL